MDLMQMVTGALGQGGVQQIASKLGVDEATANDAVQKALPVLMGGMQRQAGKPEFFAQAEAESGAVLDNAAAHVENCDPSQASGLLGNIFGGRQAAAAQALSGQCNLNADQAQNLLGMLGPLAQGAVGKAQTQGNLDAGGLQNLLGGLNLGSAGGMLGFLDKDGDGNIMDDLPGGLGGMLGGNK